MHAAILTMNKFNYSSFNGLKRVSLDPLTHEQLIVFGQIIPVTSLVTLDE